MAKKRTTKRPRTKVSETNSHSDNHHRDSTGNDGVSTHHHEQSSTPHLEHKLSETQRYRTRSTSPLLAQCALKTTPRLKMYPVRNVKGITSPSSTLSPPPKTGLSEKASASQNFNLEVSQEPQEHKLSDTQRYPTQSTSPLLAQCALKTTPRLKMYPIRNVKGITSPSSTLSPPPKTGLSEKASASQNFNLVVSQEPQLRVSEAGFSSSKSRDLLDISADYAEFDKLYAKFVGTDQASTPLISPTSAVNGLLETTSASQTFNLVFSQKHQEIAVPVRESTTKKRRGRPSKVKEILVEELGHSSLNTTTSDKEPARCLTPEVRVPEAGFSSSKSRELPDISADFGDFDKVFTDLPGTDQASTPLIPPIRAFNGNLTEGSCINGNEQSKCVGKSSSLNITQIVGMLGNSDDEVDSVVDPALVTVKGYRVKEEMAPILRSIILKYGDIAKDCSFKSTKSRSLHLEMVCAIYLNLEKRRKPTDITGLEIKNLLTEVADLEAAKVEVGWLRKRLEEIYEAMEESKMYKTRTDEKAQKSHKEEMLVKELEELKKKTWMLELEVEESRKKAKQVETQVSAVHAEVKQSDEAIAISRGKLSLFKKPLVAGLL